MAGDPFHHLPLTGKAHEAIHLFACLENSHIRNALNPERAGEASSLIQIHFPHKHHSGMSLGSPTQDGCKRFARPTPVCIKVHDDQGIAFTDEPGISRRADIRDLIPELRWLCPGLFRRTFIRRLLDGSRLRSDITPFRHHRGRLVATHEPRQQGRRRNRCDLEETEFHTRSEIIHYF